MAKAIEHIRKRFLHSILYLEFVAPAERRNHHRLGLSHVQISELVVGSNEPWKSFFLRGELTLPVATS